MLISQIYKVLSIENLFNESLQTDYRLESMNGYKLLNRVGYRDLHFAEQANFLALIRDNEAQPTHFIMFVSSPDEGVQNNNFAS